MRMLSGFASLAFTVAVIAQEPVNLEVNVNDDGVVVVSNLTNGGFWQASGVQFRSADGNLIPLEPDDVTPFTFSLSNTMNEITLGNLGSLADFDGSWVSLVSYNLEIWRSNHRPSS